MKFVCAKKWQACSETSKEWGWGLCQRSLRRKTVQKVNILNKSWWLVIWLIFRHPHHNYLQIRSYQTKYMHASYHNWWKTTKCINHHPHATFLYKKTFNLCPRPQSESKSQHYKVIRKTNIKIYLKAFYLLCKCCHDWTTFKVIFANIFITKQVYGEFIQFCDQNTLSLFAKRVQTLQAILAEKLTTQAVTLFECMGEGSN